MFTQLKEDIQEAMNKDPAARHFWEVVRCYPGVPALIAYRFNHWLWNHNIKMIDRRVSYLVRWAAGC